MKTLQTAQASTFSGRETLPLGREGEEGTHILMGEETLEVGVSLPNLD